MLTYPTTLAALYRPAHGLPLHDRSSLTLLSFTPASTPEEAQSRFACPNRSAQLGGRRGELESVTPERHDLLSIGLRIYEYQGDPETWELREDLPGSLLRVTPVLITASWAQRAGVNGTDDLNVTVPSVPLGPGGLSVPVQDAAFVTALLQPARHHVRQHSCLTWSLREHVPGWLSETGSNPLPWPHGPTLSVTDLSDLAGEQARLAADLLDGQVNVPRLQAFTAAQAARQVLPALPAGPRTDVVTSVAHLRRLLRPGTVLALVGFTVLPGTHRTPLRTLLTVIAHGRAELITRDEQGSAVRIEWPARAAGHVECSGADVVVQRGAERFSFVILTRPGDTLGAPQPVAGAA